jgi:hypothetical protein
MSGAKAADSVSQINTIGSLGSLNRAMADGKSNSVALLQAHNFGARLHPGTLLGQHELASGEILPGHGKKESYLNREDIFAVNVLVQRIPVAFIITQQQRRRSRLSSLMASIEVLRVGPRIA